MKSLVAILVLISSAAVAGSIDRSLARLDPATRLEQLCSLEAMNRVGRDSNPYHPDRAVIYAVSKPQRDGDTLTGDGGAFRSSGRWFQFSFLCQSTPDHLHVAKFTYKLGRVIPEEKWEEYGLWR